MLQSCPWDLMCLGGELLTGKSIPVLMGIVHLPIDRWLAWIVLSLGAITGVLFSVYSSRAVAGLTWLGSANRLVQLSFSLFLSFSLLLSVAKGIHHDRGMVLSLVPAFCVAIQHLPQRSSTGIISFMLACLLLVLCSDTAASVGGAGNRVLHPHFHAHASPREEAAGVWDVVQRALQLFLLAFYASVQHAPTQVYFDGNGHHHLHHQLHHASSRPSPEYALHHHASSRPPPEYASHHHAMHTRYACLVGLMSALLRVTFWYIMCFVQNNALHVILENEQSAGRGWDLACCIAYIATLLYSACWTATQLGEQVLPHFQALGSFDSDAARLKLVAFVFAAAALYRQRDAEAVFVATNVLIVVSLGTTALTLK
jgi:hypothetical protein